LIARSFANPEVSRRVAIYAVISLSALDPLGIRRVIRYEASREGIVAGDVHQRLNPGECPAGVVECIGSVCHGIAKCLGGKVMSGPYRGIAAACVVDDLAAGGAVKYGIQNGGVREVSRLNNTRDGQGISLGSRCRKHRNKC